MVVADFWIKAIKIVNDHRRVFVDPKATGEQQHENIDSFLSEMDFLTSEWYSQRDAEVVRK